MQERKEPTRGRRRMQTRDKGRTERREEQGRKHTRQMKQNTRGTRKKDKTRVEQTTHKIQKGSRDETMLTEPCEAAPRGRPDGRPTREREPKKYDRAEAKRSREKNKKNQEQN